MNVEVHLSFFYKQPVYKQLALRWPIAKQLSGLNPFPLSIKKTADERKVEFFHFSKRKVAVFSYLKSIIGNILAKDGNCSCH